MVDFLAEGVGAGHKCYCMMAPAEHSQIAAAVIDQTPRADDDPANVGDLEFTGPSGSHLQTGGFASERMLAFWDDWSASTYEQQHRTFARIGQPVLRRYPIPRPRRDRPAVTHRRPQGMTPWSSPPPCPAPTRLPCAGPGERPGNVRWGA
jgi:hypothetical protein